MKKNNTPDTMINVISEVLNNLRMKSKRNDRGCTLCSFLRVAWEVLNFANLPTISVLVG